MKQNTLWVERIGYRGRVLFFALLLTLLDTLSKIWVRSHFELGQRLTIIPGVLDFTHVQNKGAAWSLFHQVPDLLLLLVMFFCLGLIVLLFLVRFQHRWEHMTFALLLGGALGNLLNRVQLGYVTDFIDAVFIPNYPIFNVADIFVSSAVILLVLNCVRRQWPKRPHSH